MEGFVLIVRFIYMSRFKKLDNAYTHAAFVMRNKGEKTSCMDVMPSGAGNLNYLTVHDSKDELLKTASDTNPVVVKYNISTCHLFYEFKEDSYLDDKNPNFDFEGFLAVDLYSKNGQLCGVLAFGRPKGLFKSTQFSSYVVGTNGIAVFNKNSGNAKVNYCTNRIDVALKIAQCGERVACASNLDDCVEFYLNTTNNSPIWIDILHDNINALSLFNSDEILKIENKIGLQTYLQQLHADFSNQHGFVDENPQIDVSVTESIRIVNMKDIQETPIRWLWYGWLPLGKMTILAGTGGCGKTNLSLALTSIVTKGGLFPDGSQCENPGKVLIYSTEDDPADILKPRLIANGADISKVSIIDGKNNKQGKPEPFDPVKDFPKIEQYIKHNQDVKLLVIDPIVSVVQGDMNKANDVRRSLQPLVNLANQYNFAILGITHFAKVSINNNPADRILGSQAFSALARMALCVFRRETEGDCILIRAKSNISSLDGGIRYHLQSVNISDVIETTKVEWAGTIEGSAKEFLNASELDRGENNSVVNAAKDFLIELLNKVEKMASKQVYVESMKAGFSEASIRRAKRQTPAILAFKPNGQSGWYWALNSINTSEKPR